jgi:exonuclease III
MKLITWNCQGAFRKKVDVLLLQQPDIVVVQECESPEKLVFSSKTQQPNDFLWFGDNKHKGVGVFSYSDFRFSPLEHNTDIKFIIPISVSNDKIDFTLFAVWANNPNDPEGRYVEQVWKAVNHYDELLSEGQHILTGDFNSNKIWDKQHKTGNHSDVVKKLAEKDIYSVYHQYLEQEQGKEEHPTFFLHRNLEKPYHLDYCFASKELYEKIDKVEVGIYEEWLVYSDHVPLIIDFYK